MAHGFDVVKYHYFHKKLGYSSLKKEQLDIIVGFMNGRDVITVLPTRFEKTLCYACIPLVI